MNTHSTLRIIRDEHGALAAVLRSIGLLLSQSRRRDVEPDFAVLRAMLFYIDEFPEQVHHSKETALLFPAIRAHGGDVGDVLDRLDRDHVESHAAIRELEHDLLGLEMMHDSPDYEGRLERFETRMQDYVASYLDHMRVEENDILPLAEKLLTAADWATLDAAFMKNRDPLTHREADDAYRPLFKKILMTLPAPLGLGPAMQAMHDAHPRGHSVDDPTHQAGDPHHPPR